jgi:ribosomal-protein-alanine N-acetyltransferase
MQIETERLLLRPLGPEHAGVVTDFLARNRAFHETWQPTRPEERFSVAERRRLLAIAEVERLYGLRLLHWMARREEGFGPGDPEPGGRVIGSVNLYDIQPNGSARLGYRLDRTECGRGLMTEALQAVLAQAFGPMGLARVDAFVLPENAASLRVLEKLGFEREGVAVDHLEVGGRPRDHVWLVKRS